MKNYRTDAFLRDRHVFWLRQPAARRWEEWQTALPLGNGETGALLYGAAGEELLRLTRHDLWAGAQSSGPLPDISASLTEMRRLLDAEKYPEAQNVMMDALRDAGYRQSIADPFPLADVRICNTSIDLPFTHYRRGVDTAAAEAFVRWNYGEALCLRRCFVSQQDGCVWLHQSSDVPFDWVLTVGKCASRKESDVSRQIDASAHTAFDGELLLYTAFLEGKTVGVGMRLFPAADCEATETADQWKLRGCGFTLKLVTLIADSVDEARRICREKLSGAADYEAALAQHTALWQEQFGQVELQLTEDAAAVGGSNETLLGECYEEQATPAMCEKLWRWARYVFLSGTSAQTNPFPLYGLWAGDHALWWTSHVANENVELLYSPVLPQGGFAAYRGLIEYYYNYMDAFRENARQLFGCRGIFVPGYTAPRSLNGQSSAGPGMPVPVILNWISGAGWLASGFVAYYRYTHDTETLRGRILPFLIETARFYADYTCRDENGTARLYPSVSPENTPGNLIHLRYAGQMDHVCPAVVNATMDFAVMKECLTNLLQLLEEVGDTSVSAAEKAEWQALLESIPSYRIDPATGGICEWMDEKLTDNHNHRHVSHMYPVYPGNEVRADNAPELLKAFERAARRRILGSKSGWAFVHSAALWARLGDGEKAIGEIDLMTKSCLLENFFTLHNDWRHMGASLVVEENAPVQLDALMGIANALQEMLLRCVDGTLQLLPALPGRLESGTSRGWYLPQGRMDLAWDASSVSITVYPDADSVLKIMLPDGTLQTVRLQKDVPYTAKYGR